MLFLLRGGAQPRAGHFRETASGLVVVDEAGIEWAKASVALVIPDDEVMSATAAKAGYQVHTVMSANLGLGATKE